MKGDHAQRAYRQHCGLAKALDRVGERWTLLIVRDLLLGPRTWGQLLGALPGLTTNLLAKRLTELRAHGLVDKLPNPVGDPRPGRRGRYQLSARGLALEPVIMELARWGGHELQWPPAPDDRFDVGWALLSCKRRYSRAAHRPRIIAELGADQRRFQLRADPGYLDVHEGAPQRPDLVVDGDTQAVIELMFGRTSGRDLLADGRLSLVGEPAVFEDLLSSFAGVRW